MTNAVHHALHRNKRNAETILFELCQQYDTEKHSTQKIESNSILSSSKSGSNNEAKGLFYEYCRNIESIQCPRNPQ